MREKLEEEINERIQEEKQAILDRGGKLRGKFSKVSDRILKDYDLSDYEVNYNGVWWKISIHEKGTSEKRHREQIEENKLIKKSKNFIKRVKAGEIEKSVEKYIDKYYSDHYYVEHSRSMVNSESFYICEKGTGEKVVKLSLHNTAFQDFRHGTPFINLNDFISTVTLKKVIKRRLDRMEG